MRRLLPPLFALDELDLLLRLRADAVGFDRDLAFGDDLAFDCGFAFDVAFDCDFAFDVAFDCDFAFDGDLAFDCDEVFVERLDALLADALLADLPLAFGPAPLDELLLRELLRGLLRDLLEAGLLFAILIPLFKIGRLLQAQLPVLVGPNPGLRFRHHPWCLKTPAQTLHSGVRGWLILDLHLRQAGL